MKNKNLVIAITTATVGAGLLFVPTANAEEIVCQTTLGAITVDNVKVPQGKTCTLNGTRVKGNVVVNNRATLRTTSAKINGSIQAEGATLVNIASGTVVNGDVQVEQGIQAQIIGAQVDGSIQLKSNSGPLIANNNRVGSDLQVFGNRRSITLRQNRINGNLQCKENTPGPVGGGNIVGGNKEDQCARL